MVAIALSSTPGFSGYGSVKAQPTPPIEDTTDLSPDRFSEGGDSPDAESGGLEPFNILTAGLEKQEGLFTTYSDLDKKKAYLAIQPAQLDQNFIMMATIESGIGEAGLFRGWPINDLMVQFREAPDNFVHVVVHNTFNRNPEGQNWQQRLLDTSFSDSILFALKVTSIDPESRAKIIDLSDLIMNRDLLNVSRSLGPAIDSYARNQELSSFDTLKTFKNNIEIVKTASYSSAGDAGCYSLESLYGF